MTKEELERIRKKYNFRRKYNSDILKRFEKALDEQWKETDHYIIWGHWAKDAFRKLFKAQNQQLLKDWNCQCEKPKPDGNVCVGEYEGAYERCKICDRRIWH